MKESNNYQFNLPENLDIFDVEHFNGNTEKMDTMFKSLNDGLNSTNSDLTSAKEDLRATKEDLRNTKENLSTTNQNLATAKSELQTAINASGHSLSISLNTSNYVMTLKLLDANSKVLDTKTIDFPIESLVMNGSYANGVLTLVLQSGQSINIDVSDLISGLATENDVAKKNDKITISDNSTAISDSDTFLQASIGTNPASIVRKTFAMVWTWIRSKFTGKIIINLASSASATNDPSINITPGVSGTLPASNGGTGVTSLQALRNALGLGNTLSTLPVANGGTGVESLEALRNALGLGSTLDVLAVANGGTGENSLDDLPVEDSQKLVRSGGIYSAINNAIENAKDSINREFSENLAKKNDKITISDNSTAISDSDTFLQASIGTNPASIVRKTFAMVWTWIRSKFTGTIKIDLSSTSAATNNPSTNITPGVSGILSASNGGTGYTTLQAVREAMGLGNTLSTLPVANGGTGVESLEALRNALGLGNTLSTLPVANGGTGKTTHTSNAVLTGNGTSAVKNVATANGALYATAANGAPKFGTLPVAQGGTGNTSVDTTPTENSTKMVTSGGVFNAIDEINDVIPVQASTTNQLATQQYVSDKVAEIVANAPASFDTLKEIANWIEGHSDDASAMNSAINQNASDISSHTSNKSNPHGVTKAQVGLGNVTNVATESTITSGSSKNITSGAVYTALSGKNDKITVSDNTSAIADTDTFAQITAAGSNPSGIIRKTFTMVWTWIRSKFTGTIKVDLSSTNEATNDPSTNITPGVSGILPIANGGTGENSLDDLPVEDSQKLVRSGGIYSAINNAIENAKDSINREFSENLAKKNDKITISDNSTAISDSDTFLQASIGTNPASIVRKTFAMVWTWIRSKFTGKIIINLASSASATNDPSINITPGVSGTLPIANGGTGVNDLETLKSLFGLSEFEDVSVSGLCYTTPRWLIFDFSKSSHKALKIKKGTKIRLDVNSESRWFKATEDVSLDLSTMMTTAANANSTRTGAINGRDFYLYLVPSGTSEVGIVVSCNSTFPNDIDSSYTASNTRKIGQFHTLCVAAGNYTTNGLYCKVACVSNGETVGNSYLVKKYKDDTDGFATFYTKEIKEVSTGYFYGWVKTVHPLEGFAAGDILPESVWCLSFKPHCLTPDGMVYDVETDKAVDIYLQSGKGKGTVSLYQGTTTDTRPQVCHEDDMRQVGKRLPTTAEFSSFALGSNENTNITGTTDKVKTGGWTDTAGRRMISAIGCEDCCGFLWQWLGDVAPLGYGAAWGNTKAVQSNSFAAGYVGGKVSITVTELGTAATGSLSNTGWCTIDGQDDFGQMYCILCGLFAGGRWYDGSRCGSRSRGSNHAVSSADSILGARGVSHVLREA